MAESGHKTIMCSVFYLDIVGYSKKSVTGQISLKERLDRYLADAIRDVPLEDRIVLDSSHGAVISFLGDVEDALKTALNLHERLLNEDADLDDPLQVRMGVNLGPVRLVRDISGQPGVEGDGINVAKHVMGFADDSQILVSRSYYNEISRLSPQYAKMFHYQGSRTDKHVREHEVYAIGSQGDETSQRGIFATLVDIRAQAFSKPTKFWRLTAKKLDTLTETLIRGFRQAGPKQRAAYVGIAAISLLLIIVLVVSLAQRSEVDTTPDGIDKQAASTSVVPVQTGEGRKTKDNIKPPAPKVSKPKAKPKSKTKRPARRSITTSKGTFIAVKCKKGTEIFLNGKRKGRIKGSSLTIKVTPGKHKVIISHPKAGVFSKTIVIKADKIVRLSPEFCKK